MGTVMGGLTGLVWTPLHGHLLTLYDGLSGDLSSDFFVLSLPQLICIELIAALPAYVELLVFPR